MAIPADKLAAAEAAEISRRTWLDHAARTTAVLAVLAAVSSGQYASQFSQTILAQAEASDHWSYYQAKSIKRHLVGAQAELAAALAQGKEAPAALAAVQQQNAAQAKKYEAELADIKAQADQVEARKKRHELQGFWYQIAFAVLQAGVVLSTVAASSKRMELWVAAIVCGFAGLLLAANGFFLLLTRLPHS
jgi:Domain of unknown function (DUF4337)